MRRTKRIRAICAELLPCGVFADVGCDHGYCTQYMLENGLCRRAVLSDISAASLGKAEKLLGSYIRAGIAASVCCAGLERVPRDTDEVLIAGMGGDEIADILEGGFLPPVLVLQPMRNARRVREFLLANGYALTRDFTFRDGKFYDLLRAERGTAGGAQLHGVSADPELDETERIPGDGVGNSPGRLPLRRIWNLFPRTVVEPELDR